MTEILGKSRAAAARPTRTTRANPAPSCVYTAAEIAQLHYASLPLMKKYILLLRARKPLPNETKKKKGGSLPALSEAKEKALYTFIRLIKKSVFYKMPKIKEGIRLNVKLNFKKIEGWY
ncbi:hypothetical protein BGZ63DRAFT_389727 [Mariannaea sp. PMI_226]|nr:hypothetical protein BGZ63DRAFT_389727 [Mariannaea sp. PMI_226]